MGVRLRRNLWWRRNKEFNHLHHSLGSRSMPRFVILWSLEPTGKVPLDPRHREIRLELCDTNRRLRSRAVVDMTPGKYLLVSHLRARRKEIVRHETNPLELP